MFGKMYLLYKVEVINGNCELFKQSQEARDERTETKEVPQFVFVVESSNAVKNTS